MELTSKFLGEILPLVELRETFHFPQAANQTAQSELGVWHFEALSCAAEGQESAIGDVPCSCAPTHKAQHAMYKNDIWQGKSTSSTMHGDSSPGMQTQKKHKANAAWDCQDSMTTSVGITNNRL